MTHTNNTNKHTKRHTVYSIFKSCSHTFSKNKPHFPFIISYIRPTFYACTSINVILNFYSFPCFKVVSLPGALDHYEMSFCIKLWLQSDIKKENKIIL